MKRSYKKIKIGIIGCGAIGSRIAKSCRQELKNCCELNGLYDVELRRAQQLARAIGQKRLASPAIPPLLKSCDLIIEATNAPDPTTFLSLALKHDCDIMVMSVGKILSSPTLFRLAQQRHRQILIPSGAIAGIDAFKAIRSSKISKITLTTRKPLTGFRNHPLFLKKQHAPKNKEGAILIFDGGVAAAVKHFPQNINVAATLALASGQLKKIRIRIFASPKYRNNSHEIEVQGDFGRILTRTENTICPDNPKTSLLAVLSAIESIKQFCQGGRIGT